MQELTMKFRTLFAGAAVLAAVALAPTAASASGLTCSYTATLGIGGTLSGCFTFTMSELGENAGYVSQQYYWNGNFGSATGFPNNTPSPSGTQFFSDDCGSSGSTNGPLTTFAFCPVDAAHTVGPVLNPAGELVLGLLVPDGSNNGGNNYWIFSGTSARNAYPAPAGFQQVLYQLTTGGVADPGQFLFAWEDLNTGCTSLAGSSLHPSLTTFATEDLGNKPVLDNPNNCNNPTPPGGWSDADYNDSYILISVPQGTQLQVVPEPMTMTMMATGLVGLAGAGLRRRKKNQG
jgi:hypothetical protein